MRKSTVVAMFLVAVVSFGLGASLKNINSGHIEALNAILETRSGFNFGFPPDPCFAPVSGFPPDPCLVANVSPTGGLAQRIDVFNPPPEPDRALRIQLADPAQTVQQSYIIVDPAGVAAHFQMVDGDGNSLKFCPNDIAIIPPGPG
ncbi:MAG: hypothetical protein ACXWLM_04815 [Myxococcales bacterium]